MNADWSLNSAQRLVLKEVAKRIDKVTMEIAKMMEAQNCRTQFDRPIDHLREGGKALLELVEWADTQK